MKDKLLAWLLPWCPKNILSAEDRLEGDIVDAYKVISSDIEESDLDRKKMKSKLVCLLENAMHLEMKEKQYSAVAKNARVLMRLIGLD